MGGGAVWLGLAEGRRLPLKLCQAGVTVIPLHILGVVVWGVVPRLPTPLKLHSFRGKCLTEKPQAKSERRGAQGHCRRGLPGRQGRPSTPPPVPL